MGNIYAELSRSTLSALDQVVKTGEMALRVERIRELEEQLSHYSPKGGDEARPRWRTAEDIDRIEKAKMYRKLYEGDHDDLMELPDNVKKQPVNLIAKGTDIQNDLLTGGGIEVSTGHRPLDKYFADVLDIPGVIRDIARDSGVGGYTTYQIGLNDDGCSALMRVDDDVVYFGLKSGTTEFDWIAKRICLDPSDLLIPVDLEKEGKYSETGVVFEERHYVGYVVYLLYTVSGDEVVRMLDPRRYNAELPEPDEGGVSLEKTHRPFMLMQIIPNVKFNGKFLSDYASAVHIQKNIDERNSWINDILNEHARPRLILSEEMTEIDEDTGRVGYNFTNRKYLVVPSGQPEQEPKYLTWQAQLSESYESYKSSRADLATVMSISPSFFVSETSQPEAAATYRLRMTPTLNLVRRKKEVLIPALQRLLKALIYEVVSNQKQIGQIGLIERMMLTHPDEDNDGIVDADEAGEVKKVKRLDLSFAELKSENYLPSRIRIRFLPSLPQDDEFLKSRYDTPNPSISLRRILEQLDGLTGEELRIEMERIREERASQNEVDMGEGFGNFGSGNAGATGAGTDSGTDGGTDGDGGSEGRRRPTGGPTGAQATDPRHSPLT